MKKLAVSKILLLASLPMWIACGGNAAKSEITATKTNNEITFLAKKSKVGEGVNGLVRLNDGESLDQVSNEAPSEEGRPATSRDQKGIIYVNKKSGEGVNGFVAAEDIDAGKRAVNSMPTDEGVNGVVDAEGVNGFVAAEDIDAGKRAVNGVSLDEGVNGLVEAEGVNGKLGEGVNGLTILDEGVNGLMKKIQALNEGVNGKQIEINQESKDMLAKLGEGVNGLMAQVDELMKKTGGKLDEGVNGYVAELEKRFEEYSKMLADIEGVNGLVSDEGVNGKIVLEKNILNLEGLSADENVIYILVNGQEKYEIKVNPETRAYGATFELNEKDMETTVFDLVIGKSVMTFMVIKGELKLYEEGGKTTFVYTKKKD